jgi:hypothetical protein
MPQLGSVGSILAIPIGLLSCFFGYRLLKLVIGLAGFTVGCAAGVSLGGAAQWAPWLVIAAGIVVGLLAAWLAVALYFVGIFLLGVAAFAGLASLFVHNVLAVAGIGILGGILTLALQKFMLRVATAFGGASMVASGVVALIHGQQAVRVADLGRPIQAGAGSREDLLVLLGTLALGCLGLIVQMGGGKGRKRERREKED